MTKTSMIDSAYITRSAQSFRPRLVTAGVVLGALGWAMPCAHLAFFEYFWRTYSYALNPPPDISQLHEIPPLWQAYFTTLLLVWALFPFLLVILTFLRKNWAKWIFITYSVFNRSDYFWSTYAELKAHPNGEGFWNAFFDGQNFNFLLQAICLTASIVRLSLPPSNRWFKADPA
jgi:hypothetical protein